MERTIKKVSDSLTYQTQVVMHSDLNSSSRLFGGILMQWIDVVAGVVAIRHSGHRVTTASYDHLEFLAPAYLGDMIVLKGYITWVGNTSMEICVDSFVEKLGGERTLLNRAHSIFVALDENGRPTPVPGLELVNEKEKREWAAAELRKEQRKKLREVEAAMRLETESE